MKVITILMNLYIQDGNTDCHHHYKSLDWASLSHRFISPNESVAPLLIGTMRAQLNMM